MTIAQTRQIINLLQHKGVVFDNGLSDLEMVAIEEKFRVKFPPDLQRFLQCQLPVSDSFSNWRKGLIEEQTAEEIISMLNWPLEGMLFDIRSNNYWVPSWGNKPGDYESCVEIAKKHYYNYPKLIPIYSHRYIPSEPNESGNPVFSVNQMDIIYYGYDLASYFANEFNFKLNSSFELLSKPKREIDFWTWSVENN